MPPTLPLSSATAPIWLLSPIARRGHVAAGRPRLASLRNWLQSHQDQVIVAVSLLLGFWLAGKSIYLLVK